MSRLRNTTASPFVAERPNALGAPFRPAPTNYQIGPFIHASRHALLDVLPKSEYVPGHYRQVPHGLGYRIEWIAGYWRREG